MREDGWVALSDLNSQVGEISRADLEVLVGRDEKERLLLSTKGDLRGSRPWRGAQPSGSAGPAGARKLRSVRELHLSFRPSSPTRHTPPQS